MNIQPQQHQPHTPIEPTLEAQPIRDPDGRLTRRQALQWITAAAATITALNNNTFGQQPPAAQRIGSDPNLINPTVPWPRTLTPEQLKTTAAICDTIIPADDRSPSASAVGVPDFIDEWVSAPYPQQQNDRATVLFGLDWLNTESQRRFSNNFADLTETQRTAICDEICFTPNAAPSQQDAARSFALIRNLTAGAFYTTEPGMNDIGYIGNIPLTEFPGPTPQALQKLGLNPEDL